MTTATTPDDRWNRLREKIQARRTALREVAVDLDGEGKDAREPFARENELAKVLDLMTRMEAGQ